GCAFQGFRSCRTCLSSSAMAANPLPRRCCLHVTSFISEFRRMATRIPLPIVNPEYQDPSKPASESSDAAATGGASTLRTRAEGGDILEEIKKEVTENRVMLYVKGTPQAPACGFSARV